MNPRSSLLAVPCAERACDGPGCKYIVDSQAVDARGNLAVASCVVSVPHDRRHGARGDG